MCSCPCPASLTQPLLPSLLHAHPSTSRHRRCFLATAAVQNQVLVHAHIAPLKPQAMGLSLCGWFSNMETTAKAIFLCKSSLNLFVDARVATPPTTPGRSVSHLSLCVYGSGGCQQGMHAMSLPGPGNHNARLLPLVTWCPICVCTREVPLPLRVPAADEAGVLRHCRGLAITVSTTPGQSGVSSPPATHTHTTARLCWLLSFALIWVGLLTEGTCMPARCLSLSLCVSLHAPCLFFGGHASLP